MTSLSVPDRRNLLRLAAASATTLWLPRSAWSQPRLGGNPFTLGIASGSPQHDSVVLWTRLNGTDPSIVGALRGAVTVRWELAHDEHFTRIVQQGQAQAMPELAHAVHVEVSGLAADRWYFYRFMVSDAVSSVGRTRTLPESSSIVQRLRLGYASCQRWEHGFFSAWRHMRDESLDVVLFLGDYIYEYPGASRAVRPVTGGWVLGLDDYRQRYALYKSDADLQAMHAACPWLLTWDDHEVQNDYAGGLPGNSGKPVTDFSARRAAAYQAFYEHMPLRASVLTQALTGLTLGAEMRIYQQVQWGRLASLYLLDTRQYRDHQVCTRDDLPGASLVEPSQCVSWTDPARSLLGMRQEQWLNNGFSRASGQWNIIGQQTLFGSRKIKRGATYSQWNDGWDGYAAARQRLTDAMRHHDLANPVLLGGDVHENWVGHVKADYAKANSPAVGVEFCGTSISSRSAGNASTPRRLKENPHFVFAESQLKGYGLAEFTSKQLTTTLRVVDDVTKQDAAVRTLANFVVPAGRSVIES